MAVTVRPAEHVQAAGFAVNVLTDAWDLGDTNHDGAFDLGETHDGKCDTDAVTAGNQCTLRAAMFEANANGDTADTITFSVTGVITLGSTLPVGKSDPSVAGDAWAASTTITGSASFGTTVTGGGFGGSCFTLSSPTNIIQGLVISGCGNDGITVLGTSTNNIIRGNRIGTNAAGGAAFPNLHDGIALIGTSNGNTIGGTVAGQANLISGNVVVGVAIASNANTVTGNLIGTDATGVYAVPNGVGVSISGSGNGVGGTTAGTRNLVSGNAGDGVAIAGTGNTVQGNCIGTQIDCASPRPNGGAGVSLTAAGNVVGGTANVIAQNVGAGVLVTGAISNRISRNQMSSNDTCGISLAGGGNAPLGVGPTISAINYMGGTSFTVSGVGATAGATVEVFVASNEAGLSLCGAPIAAPHGQGSCFVGQAIADGAGAWSATVYSIGGYSITVTETNAAGSTSEFGTAFGAPAGPSGATCGLPLPVATSTPTPAPTSTTAPGATATWTPVPGANRFYGSVTLNGVAATAGTYVTATINGYTCGTTTVDASSNYVIDVASSATTAGCGTAGATVNFTVASCPANSALWYTGLTTNLNLTASCAAATATPTTGAMESVTLAGNACNPVASSYADATAIATIASAVSPSGILISIWWFDSATLRWLGYDPLHPANPPSDLTLVNRLDAIFICVSSAGAWSRPVI
jgi:hypothetical protein